MAFTRIAAVLLAASGAALATAPPVLADPAPPGPNAHRDLRELRQELHESRHARARDLQEARHRWSADHRDRHDRHDRRGHWADNLPTHPDHWANDRHPTRDHREAREARTRALQDTRTPGDLRDRRAGDRRDARQGPGLTEGRVEREARGPRPETRDRGNATAQARLTTCAYRVKAGTRVYVKPERGAKELEHFGSQGRTLGACASRPGEKWTKVLAPERGKIGYARTDRLKNLGPKKWLSV
ncbi:hypothetical protein [Nonomuraea sp. NPDC023979]|uniref:hypothetical protein n=1 Tax=Nonomuraea sp. NPDC023979 TaxID=3154796 RepID=UPI0033DCC02E